MTIAASLAYLLLRQQDSVGCLSFDEKVRMVVPLPGEPQPPGIDLAGPRRRAAPRDKTDLYPIFREITETYPRRGLMVVISDLFSDREGIFRGLKLLRSRGHDLMVFHVLDDDELDFPFTGPTRFDGLESPDIVRCNPRARSARATCRRWSRSSKKSAAAARATTPTTRCSAPASL